MIVYIYNFPNGKKYVGQTSQSLQQRAKNGAGYIHSPAVYNAILKYGWENISIQTFECNSKQEMDELEQYYIQLYQTYNSMYGYNLTLGGDGTIKYNHQQVIDLWNSGLSIGQISKQLKCKNNTISLILQSENLYDKDEINKRRYQQLSITNGVKLQEYYNNSIEHQQQRIQNGLKGAKARSKPVIVYRDKECTDCVGIFESGRQAAKALNIDHSIPSYALTHSHYGKGYYFYFYTEENKNDEFI